MCKKDKSRSLSSIVLDDPACVRIDDGKKSLAYFCRNAPAQVDAALIVRLKEVMAELISRNLRLCLHKDPAAVSHEMLILERKGKYYRPHKHFNEGETFHIIEGRMGVFSFDEEGKVIDSCILEAGRTFMYKVGINMHHAVMPLTDIVIYHESKPGPFVSSSDNIYPAWAPDGSDIKEASAYSRRLRRMLKSG